MHCHILPGVDDGAKNIEESKKMLEIARADGIRCIIATPHYHPKRGHASSQELAKALQDLRAAAKEVDEKMRIYLGRELYYGEDLLEDLKEQKALTMNNRACILVEFRPSDEYERIRRGLQQLQLVGYEVILAHVERYLCILEDIEKAEELYDMGIHLQVNSDSMTGERGRKVKKFIQTLLEEEMVYCVGTDAHDCKDRPPKMKKAAAYATKLCGEAYAKEIFITNAMNLVSKKDKKGR